MYRMFENKSQSAAPDARFYLIPALWDQDLVEAG